MSDDQKISGEERLKIGHFGWVVRWESSDYWLDFKVFRAIASDDAGPLYWTKPDELSSSPMSADVGECEPEFTGFVKWDGCAEFDMGCPHFCGSGDVAEFCELLRELHRLVLKTPHVDMDCAGYGH